MIHVFDGFATNAPQRQSHRGSERGVSIEELYQGGKRAALWGIGVSLVLGLAKLLGGWFGHSFALLSDSVHSLGDAITSAAIWGVLILSQRPPDREHPYGHTRAEAVIASNLAILIVLSAVAVAWKAIQDLSEPFVEPATYALWIAGVSAVAKEGLYRYNCRVATRTRSASLMAAAWDHRVDAFSSLAVLVGVALAKWYGWHFADHGAALVVAATILWAGGTLFWSSLQELMDRQAEPEILETVRREARSVPGVLDIEKLLVRKTGLEYLVDIHVEVDPQATVSEGHQIAHAVKDRLIRQIVPVKDVLVHIEPAPENKIHRRRLALRDESSRGA